jgi:putative endonuclease
MEHGGYVYILTNHMNATLYVGVSSTLKARVYDHKNDVDPRSFSSRYKTYKLVYYQGFTSIEEAILREKQLKAGSRKKKEKLINAFNKDWRDLYDSLEE